MSRVIDFNRVENLSMFFVLHFIATVLAGGKIVGGHRIICFVPCGVEKCTKETSFAISRTAQLVTLKRNFMLLAMKPSPKKEVVLVIT